MAQPLASEVSSDSDSQRDQEPPWKRAVSPRDQKKAQALWQQGNQLLAKDPAAAEAQYLLALSHWSHPKIHYNLAVARIDQSKPVEALQSIEEALRYGDAPFSGSVEDMETYQSAVRNKKLLESQLATLTLVCEEVGAEVALNGRVIFTGPGREEARVRPGQYYITASKDGFMDATDKALVLPGEHKEVTLKPVSRQQIATVVVRCDEPDAIVTLDGKPFVTCPTEKSRILTPAQSYKFTISRFGRVTTQEIITLGPGEERALTMRTASSDEFTTRTRFERWKPWAVFGSGAAMSAVGGMLYWRASVGFREFDAILEANCQDGGCPSEANGGPSRAPYRRAQWQQRFAAGSLIVGVGAMAAGVVLVAINKEEQVRIGRGEASFTVVPLLSPGETGVIARLPF